MSSARWIAEQVYVYRQPVDMRNYVLTIVMRSLNIFFIKQLINKGTTLSLIVFISA
jgi:hypothetical protein